MNVMFCNAQSICNKMDELRTTVAGEKPDVLALSETWTNENIGDGLIGIDGYELVVRKDRSDTEGGRGGGLVVYARRDICAWNVPVDTDFSQCVTIKVKCGREDFSIHSVYRSPNSNGENDKKLVEWVAAMNGTNILIGDFNLPDIDWATGTSGAKGRDFLTATTERGMEQYVEEPTHINGNILDLILCDREGVINTVRMRGRLGKSDHEMITFWATVDANRTIDARPTYDHYRANYNGMRAALEGETWEALEQRDVNVSWKYIKERIHGLFEEFTPLRRPRRNGDPPWMNSNIRKAVRDKRRAWSKWKRTGRESDGEEYRKKEKNLKKTIRSKKNEWERKIVEKRKSSPKLFFKQINRTRKTREKVAPLDDNGEIIVEPREKAEVLNRFYAKVFTRSEVQPPQPRQQQQLDNKLEEITISQEKVEETIAAMKQDSSPGPDGIPPKIFHELKKQLSRPLASLFRLSMETGKIPDDWRDAVITPIYKKKGSKSDPGNYRPVSLTNVAGKVMERIVKEELTLHIENNSLMSHTQHGFRRGKSVQTNMLSFLNKTTKWIDDGRSFDVLYLDFAKAFDKVCHQRLVVKLEEWGIVGKALKWIENWLSGRRQCVKVEEEISGWEDVLSSVLQGSVLGGILFNMYIDDIDEAVDDDPSASAEVKFADDTKVARITETENDTRAFQQIINKLIEWATKWEMTFNAGKCKVMHFGNRNPCATYYMAGEELGSITDERDLGIMVTNTLKPSRQCAVAARSAHFALSQIQRSFHFRRTRNLVPLYKTFVRPKLEFGVAAWSPWTETDIKTLEKVQERLVRLLSDAEGDSYEEKLRNAGLTTLRDRRERGDMIEVFKEMSRQGPDRWFRMVEEEARPLRSNSEIREGEEVRRINVIEVERANLEVRRNFFTVRAAKVWNQLPEHVKGQNSVNGFKNAYDAWIEKKDINHISQEDAVEQAEDCETQAELETEPQLST